MALEKNTPHGLRIDSLHLPEAARMGISDEAQEGWRLRRKLPEDEDWTEADWKELYEAVGMALYMIYQRHNPPTPQEHA